MKPTQLIDIFQRAGKDSSRALIEGVQALKHALRFGAEIEIIATCNEPALHTLIKELAPDVAEAMSSHIAVVNEDTFFKLSPKNHRTKVVALARRRRHSLEDIDPAKPIVFLEDPKDLENIGAVIRVAAAADSGAVITDAVASIWHPGVIRGAAGLHYALPVFNLSLDKLTQTFPERLLVSLDPEGEDIAQYVPEKSSVLIFGTERRGIAKQTLERSDHILRLPMKPGVSSLNLATSVAATLYMM